MAKKIISAFAPTVPVWAVFVSDKLKLSTVPVVAIALVYEEMDDPERDPWLEYQCCGPDGLIDAPINEDNFLGFSYSQKSHIRTWQEMVNQFEKHHKK